MQFSDYEKDVLRTFPDYPKRDLLLDFTLGLSGEAGEFSEKIKKYLYHLHPLSNDEHILELGDVLFYLTALGKIFGYSLEDIARMNIEKRKKRYPDGFDVAKSLNREE